jgi:hypothetical protein
MWESIKTSLREYTLAGWQWVWWLVSVILLIVDAYQKATGGTPIPSRVWGVLAVIVLFVAPFIVFHKSRLERESLKRDIEKLRDLRPEVAIKEDGFNLKVENTGGAADFEAKWLVMEARNWPSLVPGEEQAAFWSKKSTPSKSRILTYGDDPILLGELKINQPPRAVLYLYFSTHNYTNPNHLSAEYSLDSDQPRPFARLRVTILTHPAAAVPIVREVILTPDGCTIIPPLAVSEDPQPSTRGP